MVFDTNKPLLWKPLDTVAKDCPLEFRSKQQKRHNNSRPLAQLDITVAAQEPYADIQGICHPINRIPEEILGEIFSRYLKTSAAPEGPWSSASHIPAFKDSPSSPVTLSHVCGYWREVTLSKSTLWSSIAISHPRIEQLNMVQLWLKRAGVSLLSISLSETSLNDARSENYLKVKAQRLATDTILSASLSYIHRWENINFDFNGAPSNILLALREGCLPNLRYARLGSNTRPPHDTQLDRIWSILHSSPMIHDVCWGLLYHDTSYPIHVPWSQLRRISLSFRKLDEVLAVLQLCPSLETLILSEVDLTSTLKSGIALSNIRKLSVTTDDELSPLYDSLILPELEELIILRQGSSGSQTTKSFIQFLSRSSCYLKFFDWSQGYAWDYELSELKPFYWLQCEDELLAYLSAPQMRCIKLLRIHAHFAEKTIRSLTPLTTNNGTEYLLPCLENLVMRGGKVSKSTVLGMISLRRNERPSGITWLDSAFIVTDTRELYRSLDISV